MVRPTKRIAAGAGVMAITVGSMLAFSPQAYADSSTTGSAHCSVPTQPDADGQQQVTLKIASSAAPGQTITGQVTLGTTPAQSPVDVSGVQMTPSMDFKLSDGSTVTIAGAAQTMDVKAKTAITPQPFQGTFKIPASATGTLTMTPVGMTANVVAPGNITIKVQCTYTGMSPVASIALSSGSSGGTAGTSGGTSGTSGASTTGGTSSTSGTSGTTTSGTTTSGTTALPKTGPMDDALSMGLLGGTAGLLGIGAVLVATKRVRRSRA